jgi:Lsr2
VTSTRTTPARAVTVTVTVSPGRPELLYRMLLPKSSLTSKTASFPHGCPGEVSVLLVDDIDGSEAGETIPFGLGGTHYEIDLNSMHAQELRGQLERYVKAAREVTRSAA